MATAQMTEQQIIELAKTLYEQAASILRPYRGSSENISEVLHQLDCLPDLLENAFADADVEYKAEREIANAELRREIEFRTGNLLG